MKMIFYTLMLFLQHSDLGGKIQFGRAAGNISHVSFPLAYTTAPIVLLTPLDSHSQYIVWSNISGVTPSGFDINKLYVDPKSGNITGASNEVFWIAIGK